MILEELLKHDFKQQVITLVKCANGYYNGHATELSDDDFDYLEEHVMAKLTQKQKDDLLKKIHFPKTVSGWEKHKHNIAMGSQNKISPNSSNTKETYFDDTNNDGDYVVDEKLDGISLNTEYKSGKFIKALMRNDGIEGDNIYENARFFKGVVLNLPKDINCSIRGEVVITKKDFELVNKLRLQNGDDPYTALRNAAAGIANDYSGKYVKYATFIAYNFASNEMSFNKETEKKEFIKSLNFNVVNSYKFKTIDDLNKIEEDYIINKRDSLEHLIDGMVLKLNDLNKARDLDEPGKNPRSQIALKFPAESANTFINDVTWQVGKNRYTPVAELQTVKICGVQVSRATLHNVDKFREIGLSKGDTVSISRNGDVIPYFNKIVKHNGGEKFVEPTECFSCGEELVKDGAYLKCSNLECGDKKLGKVVNWFEKLEYKGLAKDTIAKIYESGIKTIKDFYNLDIEDLMKLDRMGEKSADKLIDILNSKLDIPFSKALGCLNVKNFSRSKSDKLINGLRIDSMDKLKSVTVDDIQKLDGFGETASDILLGIQDNIPLIEELVEEFPDLIDFDIQKIDSLLLVDESYCFTGSSNVGRPKLELLVKKNGGDVKKGVSKKLTYLVSCDGVKKGKYLKAEKEGVKIMSEEEFLEKIKYEE